MALALGTVAIAAGVIMARPSVASSVAPGVLVKGSSSAVYLYGSDDKRHAFPNEKVYKSWFQDFSGVLAVTDAELAMMPLGKNMTYKPGARLVKITADPKVYAVSEDGTLRWVDSEALAAELYGPAWNHLVEDIPDAFFVDYRPGSVVTSKNDYEPSGEMARANAANLFLVRTYATATWSGGGGGGGSTGGGGGGGSSSSSQVTQPGETTPATVADETDDVPLTAFFNGPTGGEVPPGVEGIALLEYTLTAESDLEFRNTRISYTVATSSGVSQADSLYPILHNIRIVDLSSGGIVAGPIDGQLTGVGTEGLVFTEDYSLADGTSKDYAVQADISGLVDNGMTIQMNLGDTAAGRLFGETDVYDSDGSEFLSDDDIVPFTPHYGNSFTIERPSLSVALASSPISQTYALGSEDVPLVGIVLRAGDTADVTVSSMVLTGYMDVDQDGTFSVGEETVGLDSASVGDEILVAGLWNGTTQIGHDSHLSLSTGQMVFSDLGLNIAKGTSVVLALRADLSFANVGLPNDIKFDLTPNLDIIAVDEDSSVIDVLPSTGMINGTETTAIVKMTVLPSSLVTDPPVSYRAIDGQLTGGDAGAELPYYAVVIDNLLDARPQTGLNQASVVYEAPVEGDITRLVGVFAADVAPATIGPVRSARPYLIDFAAEYGAVLAHVGGSPEALERLETADEVADLDEFDNGDFFWRDAERSAPHDAYTSGENLAAFAAEATLPELDFTAWSFKDDMAASDRPTVSMLEIGASGGDYESDWTYDSTSNSYAHAYGTEPHVDAVTGEAVKARNVLVQFTSVEFIDGAGRKSVATDGTGNAMAAVDGHVYLGTWTKDSLTGRTVFYDGSGDEIQLNRGLTWVEVVSLGTPVEYYNDIVGDTLGYNGNDDGYQSVVPSSIEPPEGSLIKASLPTVYYIGQDSKRYVIPNQKTYSTWYEDFSDVHYITDETLAAIPIGGNATYRPGIRMMKITTDQKVYAVAKGGVLRWVTSEAVAAALYGADWNQMIDDVPDSYFINYTIGADINSASDFNPAAETASSMTIDQDKDLVTSGGE
jgi:hypothetical protein